jgi:hypothetical protein
MARYQSASMASATRASSGERTVARARAARPGRRLRTRRARVRKGLSVTPVSGRPDLESFDAFGKGSPEGAARL